MSSCIKGAGESAVRFMDLRSCEKSETRSQRRKKRETYGLSQIVSAPVHQFSRPLLVIAAGLGMLLAVTLLLWVHYGSAVFYEMILAGITACL